MAVTLDERPAVTIGQASGAPAGGLVPVCDQWLALAHHEVSSYAARLPGYVDVDDLAGAAVLGLVEAASRFDPTRGVPFEPWARLRIRGAILDAARKADFAGRSTRSAARDAESVTASLAQELGRTPTRDEVAERLGITPTELAALRGRVHAGLVVSLDASLAFEDSEDGISYSDTLVDAEIGALELLERRELDRYVRDAVSGLPERLRGLITDYFYGEKTSAQIAEAMGVTESRVSQLRTEALRLLREAVGGQYAQIAEATARPVRGSAAEPAPAGDATGRGAALARTVAGASSYAERLTGSTDTLL